MIFPQLTTGALVQYPFRRRSLKRTVVNRAADGTVVKYADDNAAAVEWTLQFEGLSEDEWTALEALFQAAEGQLNTFTFVDPLGNILAWSTDLTQSVWQRDPALAIASGQADPFGGNEACRFVNNAQVAQSVSQSVGVPSGHLYTFSVYASSPSSETITLVHQSGSSTSRVVCPIGGQWTRCVASARLTSSSELVSFGVELEPGATVVLAGAQAEAQPRAGAYIRSFSKGAVYAHTRFADDGLETVSTAPDQYSCTVRLRSTGA